MNRYRKCGAKPTDFYTLAKWLENLEPFTNGSKTFRGEANPYISGYGWLNNSPDDLARLREAYVNGHVDYVVYSYNTPIVWHDKQDGWIDPGHSYSHTTAQHYGPTITAIGVLDRV